jgi:hypothetical protein
VSFSGASTGSLSLPSIGGLTNTHLEDRRNHENTTIANWVEDDSESVLLPAIDTEMDNTTRLGTIGLRDMSNQEPVLNPMARIPQWRINIPLPSAPSLSNSSRPTPLLGHTPIHIQSQTIGNQDDLNYFEAESECSSMIPCKFYNKTPSRYLTNCYLNIY